MLDELRREAAQIVSDAAGAQPEKVLPTIETSRISDLASKYAFILSKEKKENPAKLAAEIAKKIKKSGNFEKIEAAGPYINFYFSDRAYAKMLSDILEKKNAFGKGKSRKEKALIEFPSVNPNKPWHIGHLRNAVLGESVARILEFDGYSVERMDYINDLGLQVAQSLWGFLNSDAKPEGKFDQWLGEQYVDVAKKFEEDEKVAEQVRKLIVAMEEGNNKDAEAGRKLAEDCVRAQYQTALDFGVTHDVLVFESDIMKTIFDEGIEYLKNNDSVVLEKEGKNKGC